MVSDRLLPGLMWGVGWRGARALIFVPSDRLESGAGAHRATGHLTPPRGLHEPCGLGKAWGSPLLLSARDGMCAEETGGLPQGHPFPSGSVPPSFVLGVSPPTLGCFTSQVGTHWQVLTKATATHLWRWAWTVDSLLPRAVPRWVWVSRGCSLERKVTMEEPGWAQAKQQVERGGHPCPLGTEKVLLPLRLRTPRGLASGVLRFT